MRLGIVLENIMLRFMMSRGVETGKIIRRGLTERMEGKSRSKEQVRVYGPPL